MSWNTCNYEDCEAYTARPDGEHCETHRRFILKLEQDEKKATEKRKALLSKPNRWKPKPISEKRKKDNILYSKRRKKHLEQYPECQLKLLNCTKKATQIHHAAGRIGSNLTNQKHFKSTCDTCHRQLHDKLSAQEARDKGLKI